MGHPVRFAAVVTAVGLLVAACGGGDDTSAGSTSTKEAKPAGLVAQVASYDLVTGGDQRVLVGLQSGRGARLVSFGTVELTFAYVGTTERPESPVPGPTVAATFLPISGQTVTDGGGPRFVDPSEGIGVYRAPKVPFDRAGSWQVQTTALIDGATMRATGMFTVRDVGEVPAPGEPAPRTQNHLPGATGVPPKAVDSRAEPAGRSPTRSSMPAPWPTPSPPAGRRWW